MENKDMINIREEGDPMRKWHRIAQEQIINELKICPCCKGDNVDCYSSEIEEFFRCCECYCCWDIDYDKVKAEAERRVAVEKAAGPEYFFLDIGLAASMKTF